MDEQIGYLAPAAIAKEVGGGVRAHHIARLMERGEIPYRRAGTIRVVATADLDLVRAVCRQRGYLRQDAATCPV